MSGSGTKLPTQDVRYSVAFGDKADLDRAVVDRRERPIAVVHRDAISFGDLVGKLDVPVLARARSAIAPAATGFAADRAAQSQGDCRAQPVNLHLRVFA
jgi:hypothetical protein